MILINRWLQIYQSYSQQPQQQPQHRKGPRPPPPWRPWRPRPRRPLRRPLQAARRRRHPWLEKHGAVGGCPMDKSWISLLEKPVDFTIINGNWSTLQDPWMMLSIKNHLEVQKLSEKIIENPLDGPFTTIISSTFQSRNSSSKTFLTGCLTWAKSFIRQFIPTCFLHCHRLTPLDHPRPNKETLK